MFDINRLNLSFEDSIVLDPIKRYQLIQDATKEIELLREKVDILTEQVEFLSRVVYNK